MYPSNNDTEHVLPSPARYVLGVALVLVFLCALLGNAIVIGTLFRSWHNTVTKTGNYLVFLLAIVDLSNAVLNMPVVLVTLIAEGWVFGDVFCKISGFFFISITTTANSLLSMISVNRYYLVRNPNIHERIAKKRATRMSLLSLCHGLIVGLTLVGWWGDIGISADFDIICMPSWEPNIQGISNMIFVWLVAFLLPVTIMTVSYAKIFKLVQLRVRRITPNVATFNTEDSVGSHKQSTTTDTVDTKQAQYLSPQPMVIQGGMEGRTAVTLLILLGIFSVCWIPFMILTFVRTATDLKGETLCTIQATVVILVLLNSACNPIVYSLRSASFRVEAAEMVCCTERRT